MVPWTVARQAPLSMEFSQQDYCGLPFPSPGNLPNPSLLHCRLIPYHLSHQGSLGAKFLKEKMELVLMIYFHLTQHIINVLISRLKLLFYFFSFEVFKTGCLHLQNVLVQTRHHSQEPQGPSGYCLGQCGSVPVLTSQVCVGRGACAKTDCI